MVVMKIIRALFSNLCFLCQANLKAGNFKKHKTQTFVVVDNKATYFCIKFPDIFFKSIEFMIIYDNSYRVIYHRLYRIIYDNNIYILWFWKGCCTL